jgi:hypothetical protein
MIAVLSLACLTARFTTAEWTAVFAGDPEGAKSALVPIMVEKCRPEGLLSQLVQIRIYGLDEAAARKQVLEGVRRERNKPATPPPFPGTSTGPSTGPGFRCPVSGGGESARLGHVGAVALAEPGAADLRIVAP